MIRRMAWLVMSDQALAPDVHPHDFCKEPKLVYKDDHGLVVRLTYSRIMDKANSAPWFLSARLNEIFIDESDFLYDIPDLRDVFQFAGDCIVNAWNEGLLEIKKS